MTRDGDRLLKAAQNLDEDALNAIFDQFAPALYKYSLRSCHDVNVADNIVSDVFTQLVEKFDAGEGPKEFLRVYLYKTAYELLLNHSRGNPQGTLLQITLPREEDQQSVTLSSRTEKQAMEALISALNSELTYDQRHVIILRFLEDFSIKETSQIIGKGVNNIKVIQNRGIAKLRRVLDYDKRESYFPDESNHAHQEILDKPTIDTLSSILPGTLDNVTSWLAGGKTESLEEIATRGIRLYVGNLPSSIDDENLLNLFSKAGTVKSAEVFKDIESRESIKFAHIVMSTLAEAIRAMYMFHRRNLDGNLLIVKIGEKEQEDDIDELSSDRDDLEERRLRVFLCHAHRDALAVQAMYKRLTNSNIDTWLDKEKLLPGSDWEHEIRRAVRESDIVIVCLSKGFDQRGFRQKEVRIALEESTFQPEGEIFIIPARLEECEVLPSLRHLHWVNLFEPDGYEKLLRTLKVRAQKIGAVL